MNTPWENSGDILQGIMATRIPAPHTSVENPPDNLMTPSDLTLGDPASFLGFQFASSSSSSSAPSSDPAVLPHRPASLLSPWWPHHYQPSSSSSSSSSSRDYAHYQLSRRSHDQDAWNPLQVTGVPTNAAAFPILPSRTTAYPTDGLARRCSTGQRSDFSENGSHLNGIHPSDSGYSSQSCTTRSVTSYAIDSACSPYLGPAEQEPEEKPVLDLNVVPPGDAPLIRMNHLGSPSFFCQDTIRCDYPGCTWTGKCPSDKRKHEARHKKSFKCDEPNCSRKEGFGTINDLARHKKCVHKQEPERGPKVLYLCFGEDCPRRNKRWPRLDNFRQHLARMHHEEDADALLKRSLDWYETCEKPQELARSLAGRFGDDASTAPPTQFDPGDQPGDSGTDRRDTSPEQRGGCPLVEETTESSGESTPTQPPLPDLEPMELPALNALHLDTLSDRKSSISSQGSGVRTERMDDMISEAATNMINAMTKIINNGHRRRSHQPDGDNEQDSSPLSDPKREMLQRILTVALDRLSGSAGGRRPSAVESGKKEWIQCEFCTKRTRLRCEMKKHKKRHERPYGCTFPNCPKTFGSKADWKRHENSQHYHLESWRCPLPDGTVPCARVFHRQEIYAQHLKKHHACTDETAVQTAIARDKVGREGGHAQSMSQFWCGFCGDVVPLRSEEGLGAWNERFNHIDREHFRRGERIEEWRSYGGEGGRNGAHDEGNHEDDDDDGDEEDDEAEDDDSDSDSDGMHDDEIMVDEEGPSMAPPPSLKRKRCRASPVDVCQGGEEKRAKMAGGLDYVRTSGFAVHPHPHPRHVGDVYQG
ncbi:putative C2H2 finger domain protein [Aspergillus candidus]|uniref:C2H2-type domain-containing protein n=1 Tax=Aspergillus candidus TaxID=41067 RepID=A0A2I2F9B6_ASPCN|nr:hypothetical protein BDW47DRAFT_126648 [Aspergillus candidus]PLB37195.1 hypothetical protein BDW47DRAFT_126648 [Aspergillus candidus]